LVVSVFFIVLIGAFAALAFFTEPSRTDKLIHARLVSLDQKVTRDIDDEGGIVKEITFSTIPWLDHFLRENRLANGIQLLIEQAAVNWTVGRLIFATLSAIGLGAALGNLWIAPSLLGWLPGLVVGMGPYLLLVQKRKSRLRRFAALLPDAIDLMSRSLRAGQALPSSLEIVGHELADPVGPEFRRAADEQSFGLPFREALINLSRRIPLPDLHFLVTAVLVQKETGGNLVQILDKTSHLIRERGRVEGQMRIRTAQGRITGWVLCGLPFVIFMGMNLLSPGYDRVLFEDAIGQKFLMVAAVMMVIGMLVVRKMTQLKV